MSLSTDPQSFLPYCNDPPPRSRQLSASIWAPQSTQCETSWSKARDNFSRGAQQGRRPHPQLDRVPSFPITREDVFGPGTGSKTDARQTGVGAIGEGRKKTSPTLDDSHVEQLLRVLNLSSPAPLTRLRPEPLSLDTSNDTTSSSFEDFSPMSSASTLLTPTDLSPARPDDPKLYTHYDPHTSSFSASASAYTSIPNVHHHNSLLFEQSASVQPFEHHLSSPQSPSYRTVIQPQPSYLLSPQSFPLFETLSEQPTPAPTESRVHSQHQPQSWSPSSSRVAQQELHMQHQSRYCAPIAPESRRNELRRVPSASWRQTNFPTSTEWLRPEEKLVGIDYSMGYSNHGLGLLSIDQQQPQFSPSPRFSFSQALRASPGSTSPLAPARSSTPILTAPAYSHEPINFLSLLHPASSPPYHVFVSRIIKSSDQQASIFLQQKLKVADIEERGRIVDAICAKGFEMMAHRFGNWAVQRCLEAASTLEERRKIVDCMKGRVVELATNCYGCHVLQKALDCEEQLRLAIVTELLTRDPAQTLVNKHASHVWSKIMELSWTEPAPPIFAFVNKSLKGQWAALACHETGSLVIQHAFENLEDSAKDGIVEELLSQGSLVFGEVCMNQWGSYCIQH
ncbi:hypothetical protein HWV62_22201, partial [Athelia sp. TMB]